MLDEERIRKIFEKHRSIGLMPADISDPATVILEVLGLIREWCFFAGCKYEAGDYDGSLKLFEKSYVLQKIIFDICGEEKTR